MGSFSRKLTPKRRLSSSLYDSNSKIPGRIILWISFQRTNKWTIKLFPDKCIGRQSAGLPTSLEWPPRSPDLSPSNSSLLDIIKNCVSRQLTSLKTLFVSSFQIDKIHRRNLHGTHYFVPPKWWMWYGTFGSVTVLSCPAGGNKHSDDSVNCIIICQEYDRKITLCSQAKSTYCNCINFFKLSVYMANSKSWKNIPRRETNTRRLNYTTFKVEKLKTDNWKWIPVTFKL